VGEREHCQSRRRRQLIIEGVATDPLNPVLRSSRNASTTNHVGAVKFLRGIGRDELANALAALAIDPTRSRKPIGLDAERSASSGHT